jgi:transposase
MGLVERGGRIIAGAVPDATTYTLDPIIRENVRLGSTISTDEWVSYKRLGDSYIHGRVRHNRKEYVRGIHHVNTLEGHWSHFKCAIRGTHVSISAKHLWKYVAEFSYRRNYRHSHSGMFNLLMAAFALPRLADD